MYKLRKISIILLLLVMSGGCVTKTEKLKVAVIVKSTNSQFFKSVQSGANAACKEYNIDMTFMGPENEEDYQTQIEMVYKAIRDQVDAIVLSAIDYNKLVIPLEDAIKQDIIVISIDSDVHSKKVSRRITTNNHSAGAMAKDAIHAQQETYKHVGIVNFDANTANGQERENGFKQAIQNDKSIVDVYTTNVQSNVDSATKGCRQLLQDHPEINTIITFNEWTTLGVGYAIQQLQKGKDVFVIGFDNNPISVGMLETGEVDALIVQNPFVMGYLGIEQAQQIGTGKQDREDKIIYTKTVLVTKENMFDSEIQKILFPFD